MSFIHDQFTEYEATDEINFYFLHKMLVDRIVSIILRKILVISIFQATRAYYGTFDKYMKVEFHNKNDQCL